VTHRQSHLRAVLAAATALTLGRAARADDPSDLEAALSEPVVTTASQTAEDQSTAPATSTTITADDLRRYGIKTLAEAINFLSLGMVTQNNLDDGEIGARGVLLTGDYGDHVLLLIDGHAVNEAWDGTAYFGRGAGVPFELIDHIEVILGPGSVLYGSQAMLGVINIVTKRAKDWEGYHFVGESDLFTSGRVAAGFGHEFTLLGKRAELTYEMEYYGQTGPAFTMGPQNYGQGTCLNGPPGPACRSPGVWGGYPATQSNWASLPDGYMRIVWGDFELGLHAESYKRSDPTFGYNTYNLSNTYEIDQFLSADLRHRWAISSIAQLRTRLYGDAYDYRQQAISYNVAYQCDPGQVNGCEYELPGYSRWVGLEEQLTLDWLHDQSLTTLLGVDGRAIRVGEANYYNELFADAGPAPVGVFDKAEYRVAVYGQQTWRPVKWLSLNGGARLDEDDRVDDHVDYGRVSPRGVVAVNPWRSGTLKVIYSEAFRAPSYYETSYTDHQTEIPNLSLQPEVVQSGEVSFEQRAGTQRAFLGGFYAAYSDMVLAELAPTSALVSAVQDHTLPAPSKNYSTLGGPAMTSEVVAKYGPNGDATEWYQNLSSIKDIGLNAAFEGSALNKDLRYGLNVTWASVGQRGPNPALSLPAACPGSPPGTRDSATCTLPLTVAPTFFGNARVSYDLPGDWPILGVAASLVGRRPADAAFDSGWNPPPYAPTQLDLRGTISGQIPGLHALSYRFIVDYAIAAVNPYVIGPASNSSAANPAPELLPVDQLRTTLGLQYDIR
jgi:outer membrane receptor for ferrienterochelin and colicins